MRIKILSAVLGLTVFMAFGGAAMFSQGPPAGGGGGQAGRGGGRGGFTLPPLRITTSAWEDGGIIPAQYTNPGGSTRPALSWTGAPDTTVSYALIFHDIDVSFGGNTEGVLHWALWNIPATTTSLAEGGGVPEGAQQGQRGYFGPGAPAGERYHHYVFELYALNGTLELPANATRPQILEAMNGKVVAKAAYVGRYRGAQ